MGHESSPLPTVAQWGNPRLFVVLTIKANEGRAPIGLKRHRCQWRMLCRSVALYLMSGSCWSNDIIFSFGHLLSMLLFYIQVDRFFLFFSHTSGSIFNVKQVMRIYLGLWEARPCASDVYPHTSMTLMRFHNFLISCSYTRLIRLRRNLSLKHPLLPSPYFCF